MTIDSSGRIFLIIAIGAGAHGEMSIGGGIVKLENFTIRSMSLLKGISDGGMGFQIIRICLLTIWICHLPGFDTTRTFRVFGGEIKLLPTG